MTPEQAVRYLRLAGLDDQPWIGFSIHKAICADPLCDPKQLYYLFRTAQGRFDAVGVQNKIVVKDFRRHEDVHLLQTNLTEVS